MFQCQGKTLAFELNIEAKTLTISNGPKSHKADLGANLKPPVYICASSTLSVAKVGCCVACRGCVDGGLCNTFFYGSAVM